MRRAGAFVWAAVFSAWCLAVSANETPESNKPPTTVDLSGDWAFAYTNARSEHVPPAEAFKATMPVPGCWDDRFDRDAALAAWPSAKFNPDYAPIHFPTDKQPDASLPYLVGTGWYRKQLDVPAAWKGRQVTLRVGRVVMEAWAYVNGREVHHHLGHSTDWEVPLGPHLDFGRTNELVIAVDNTRTDRLGCIVRGWKGRSAGIFGPVAIRVAGSARIADLYVYPNTNRLDWRVELQGDLPKECRLEWRILDPSTSDNVIAEGTEPVAGEQTRWDSDTFGLKPWSDRQPNLYLCEVRLLVADACLDAREQPLGVRRLTRAGTGLRLNGRPVFLRGVCESSFYPLTCTPPTDAAWYREHVRRLKEIGFNWLRFHTSVPLEPYLDAADELGMLVQVEPPVGYTLDEWRDILLACRRHPSVVIYCCGNEELLDERKIEYLRQCEAMLRTTVPDALFNPQEALRGVEYGWKTADVGATVEEPFPHNRKRLTGLKEFSDVFGQYTWGWVSYRSLSGEPDAIDQRLAIYERPCLTHELGICGCYVDLSLQPRYEKLRIGPGLYAAVREELRKAGLLDRAAVYYRNSAAWQRLMLKDAMETARRCRLFAGYDCLGANDTHWHRSGYGCGVLNEFDEMKPGRSVDDILSYNGESVLLVSRQRERNLASGEPLERDIFVSWFGETTLQGAVLRWSLTAPDGTVLARGEQAIAPVEPGRVERIAAITASVPKLDRSTKATLTVELAGADVRLHNQWDYWLFPAGEHAAPENVLVATELDAATLGRLIAGERVVLLGSKPFPARAMSFQMGLAGRPEGHLATVIARHPLMDRFAHDGYCDWQFSKMFHGAAAVGFDEMSEAFDPILEVASSYKNVRRQAAVFEWRVGRGRLLVCSLRLPKSDPAAVYFRRCLLDYAAGEQFQPRVEVAPDRLAQVLKLAPSAIQPAEKTDEGLDRRGQVGPK